MTRRADFGSRRIAERYSAIHRSVGPLWVIFGRILNLPLYGRCDHVSVALHEGIVQADGRDLAANFIDAMATQKSWQNQTVSQVVEQIAASHGMTADVTPTEALVGRMYQIDHNLVPTAYSRSRTEWDLMSNLAQDSQYDLWVDGSVLHFHPHADPASADPYV